MACLTSRSSRGWDGAISYARSSRSGCADGPERRRGFNAARSSKSHPRSGYRSMPTVRSPGSSRSRCVAAQARCACTDEFPSHVDPRPHVYPYTRKRPGDLALAKRDEQLLRGREGGDVHVGAADLDAAMRVAANTTRQVVRAGELEGAHVAR